jgi:hypothetical protein
VQAWGRGTCASGDCRVSHLPQGEKTADGIGPLCQFSIQSLGDSCWRLHLENLGELASRIYLMLKIT